MWGRDFQLQAECTIESTNTVLIMYFVLKGEGRLISFQLCIDCSLSSSASSFQRLKGCGGSKWGRGELKVLRMKGIKVFRPLLF